ncbi:hypothetical protein MKZ02_12620 [Pseudobacillus sp. FSL P4-0506]|uniref:hypothetical protein n=1 Tax=Pseudobacillus sp. FSL P4-0506 TaxID=2921576 RepID=UPI0030F9F7B9
MKKETDKIIDIEKLKVTNRGGKMDIFEQLEELQKDLNEKTLDEIEVKYYQLCLKLAGIKLSNEIKEVDLYAYTDELKIGLNKALDIAKSESAKAIYFEYDLDNNWDSTFFICEEYSPLEDNEEDWACDWIEDLEGPSLERFSEIYSKNGFDGSNVAIGSTIYLVTRTVVSYVKVFKELSSTSSIPVCIAFHDQDPILRVK